MRSNWRAAAIIILAACSSGQMGQVEAQEAPPCRPMTDRMPLADRPSPYDSVVVELGEANARICYGRPSLRGRDMLGSMRVPYDTLWRTGANEPTTIHVPVAADIGGIPVAPGSYSLYTVPRAPGQEWTLIVNASTGQWGHEGAYSPRVRAQEVGRAEVPSERLDALVERFTIRSSPLADGSEVILEWEDTRVRFVVRPRN